MKVQVLFVDLNSYFASVEQAEDPRLMGKPVAVVPMMADTTCCLAASYPAKDKGVRTGTSVRDARRLCPGIHFVQADHKKYVRYHHKIVEAVNSCLPVWKIFSIDEMAIRLFGREQELEFAQKIATEVRTRIAQIHPALTCSIGMAPNRYLAKVASDMQKPNGLVVILEHELPEKLFSLELRDLPGIGPRLEKRLLEHGCFSVRDLATKSVEEMRLLWGGKVGEEFWRALRGDDIEEKATERATIGHSRVLSPDSRTPEYAWAHLVALLSKAAMRLRDEGYYTKSLRLSLKLLRRGPEANYWESKVRFPETQDTVFLIEELAKLWSKAPQQHILRIAVTLSALVPLKKHQLSLFEDDNREQLMSAFDTLNKKYRKNLIVIAESSELEQSGHAPIAFSHIPSEFE